MIKSIKEFDINNKKILMRVDFNVEFDKEGRIRDMYRLERIMPTVNYILENNGKLILLAHLGEPALLAGRSNGKSEEFSLKRILPYFEKLLAGLPVLKFRQSGKSVVFFDDCLSEEAKNYILNMKAGEIVLLDNLRFYPEEKNNDKKFAAKMALLGDIYVNEAFSVSHRNHASVAAITKFLPSVAGLLLIEELNALERILKSAKKPLTVILGGAKISSKLPFIKKFLPKADNLILGGALANTLLQAKGIAIGRSFFEKDIASDMADLFLTDTKIHLPVDIITAKSLEDDDINIRAAGKIDSGEIIYDIGPETIKLFSKIIQESNEIIWNGPMGLLEVPEFSQGTFQIAKAVSESSAYSVIGGGETVMALHRFGLSDKISHISTAGGAMLQYLAGELLPGIEALKINK